MDDNKVWLSGETEDVLAVKQLFADLHFEADGVAKINSGLPPVKITVKKFKNWYKDMTGKKPLYCLIPDRIITSIWPPRENVDEVKYGMASNENGRVCPGVVVHLKNRVGLYFCLTPDAEVLTDNDSFGI